MQARKDIYSTPASEVMQQSPHVIDVGATLGDALLQTRRAGTSLLVLPVADSSGRLHGLLSTNELLNG